MSFGRVGFALFVLTAAPALAAKPRVVVLNVATSEPSMAQLGVTVSEMILTEMGRSGRVETIGQSDIAAVLGLEKQKELLGCGEASSSCLAEFSAALGAPFITSASLARLGGAVRFDLKIIRASDGSVVSRDGRTTKNEGEVFELVTTMVRTMMEQANLGADAPPSVTSSGGGSGPPKTAGYVLIGVGVVSFGVGLALTFIAASQLGQLNSLMWRRDNTWTTVKDTGDAYNRNIAIGPALLGVGIAAAAAGVVVWRMARPSSSVALVPTLNGVALGGLW